MKTWHFAWIIAALLGATAMTTDYATANVLSGDSLRGAVEGKRIYLRAPLRGEFPLYYQRGGRVTGDGTKLGLGRFFAPRETGRWWVAGDQMCQRWPTWYNGRTMCFKLEPIGGNRLKWTRDDGLSGIARLE